MKPRQTRQALRRLLGDEIRASQAAVDALDEAVAADLGVNRTDLRCLDVLMQMERATPGALGARLGLTSGSVTVMLDRLEQAGYIARSRDSADRRKVSVRPTPEAVRRASRLYGPVVEQGTRFVAGYTAAELELLITFLRRSRAIQEEHAARLRSRRAKAP